MSLNLSPAEKWGNATTLAATALSVVRPDLELHEAVTLIETFLGGPLRKENRVLAAFIYGAKEKGEVARV